MAEVTNSGTSAKPTSLGQQIWLVVGLRWKTFRNGLRSKSETMHLAGTVALGLIFALMAVGLGFGICYGSYELASSNQFQYLIAILWGIFVFWQFIPVLASQVNPGFDGRNLLRFPLRFSAFFLMNLAYGLADPFALAGIFWHLMMGIGVTVARPDLWPWVVFALGASAVMNLAFNRMLFAWVERFLAKRRTREVLGAVFILVMISFQFTGPLAQRYGKSIQQIVKRSAVYWRILPPGEAAAAIGEAASGKSLAALETIGLLAMYVAAFSGLFAFRVHAQYTGEDLGETTAPVAPVRKPQKARAAATATVAVAAGAAPSTTSRSFASNFFGGPVAAIYAKEFRYLIRNTMMLTQIFMPLILVVLFSMNMSITRHGSRPPSSMNFVFSNMLYPFSVAYVFLLIMQYCPNSLAYDGRGVERLFLSPVKFRDVMIAKNLFHVSLMIVDASLAFVVVTALGHLPTLQIIVVTWMAVPFAAFVHFMVGNWLSLQFPRKFEFGLRRQRPSGMTMAISFGLFAAMNGVLALSALLCIWLANLWVLAAVYAGLSLAAFMVYRATLEDTSRQAIRQRDSLLEQLAR